LVYVELAHQPYIQIYAVTNRHVLNQGFLVLRLNTRDAGVATVPTELTEWFFHPDNDDVSARPLDMGREHQWLAVNMKDFVTEEMVASNTVGVGDEVFMVGRLVTREGIQQNNPVVRFGHLSMMRDAIKREDDGGRQESFLVECRSISGFSGSPVFVQPSPQGVAHFGRLQIVPIVAPGAFEGVHLLGIDWCHIPLWKNVYQSDEKTPIGLRMEQNTGIAGVVPAWRLAQILNHDTLVEQRRKEDEKIE
jgi:hypothetical protein